MTTGELIKRAVDAKHAVGRASSDQKNHALLTIADALTEFSDRILSANEQDRKDAENVLSPALLDRLLLSEKRIAEMADGIRSVARLEDPVGRILETAVRPNGLRIEKIAAPMGVIAIIYESRPNVTSDAAALALKAGSACILRSGREAHRSAEAIVASLKKGLTRSGLPEDAVVLVEDTSHASAEELMKAHGKVDLLIPRGGAGLIRRCVENATVPVLETGTGICHVYIERSADQDMALDVLENAKCSRPSVCNAAEVCLVDRAIAGAFLPKLFRRLVKDRKEKGLVPVELRLDPEAAALIPGVPAGETDFRTEYLDYVLAVGVVDGPEEAAETVFRHSTGHSEAILTRDPEAEATFVSGVDSAVVYVNASTRFTDGGEFGLGCEMGLSTQKLHARGPIGLRELCTYRYVVHGDGQIR
ncbi:MAG: glutamate-5-semialdehyde dehydrogenase [Clostridia bacterium]|nr:glutamate-5-semialdehyde dehydrogenase [Clostridia bacterium]